MGRIWLQFADPCITVKVYSIPGTPLPDPPLYTVGAQLIFMDGRGGQGHDQLGLNDEEETFSGPTVQPEQFLPFI